MKGCGGIGSDEVQSLLAWYDQNHRDLPWRHTKDPYAIWVSEIMLQQTRVETVIPYYHRFLDALSDIPSLADCEEAWLLKLWEGLGYYSRVRNMKRAAQQMVRDFDGQMPRSCDTIRTLCGIGPYTAGAIASVAFGEAVPAVDGNVLRVVSRLREDPVDIKSDEAKRRTTAWIQKRIPADAPGAFNQAMMELGACVCVPNGAPRCGECPLRNACLACLHHTTDRYPVRSAAKARRIERRTVLLVQNGTQLVIARRPARGLLAGLYELPSVDGWVASDEALETVRRLGGEPLYIEPLPEAKHVFSHVEWHMRGYRIRIADDAALSGTERGTKPFLADVRTIRERYAIPAAFAAFMEQA